MAQAPTELEAVIAVGGGMLTGLIALRVPRQELDRVPMSGLILLLAIHAIAGWALAIANVTIAVWIGATAAIFAVAMVRSIQLGRAGVIAFGGAAISAIVWGIGRNPTAQMTAVALLLIGIWLWTIGGARYRMERAGFGRSIRWTLAIVGWEGLWIGWLIHTFVAPQVGSWLR